MANKRITASNSLAPVQELAVNPFHSYDSNNVNMLTRMITGNRDRDVIVHGLDAKGIPLSSTEILDTPVIDENFLTFDSNKWELVGGDFVYDTVNKNLRATKPTSGSTFFEVRYKLTDANPEIFSYYKIEFDLGVPAGSNGTPLYVYVSYAGHTETYKYPVEGSYAFYIQAENETDTFRLNLVLDASNPFMPTYATIDNIKVTRVIRQGGDIEAITDQTVDQNCIRAAWLRPHQQVKIDAGVAVKDDVMLNILGTDPANTPVVTLTYGNDSSWIGGPCSSVTSKKAFTDLDFSFPNKVADIPIVDDGNPDHQYYCDFPGYGGGSDVKWAYICVYYAYYKNPVPNVAYIGLAREEEVFDPIFGQDYLPLAKVRFISKDVVDAIFYYPDRVDWTVIDASKVSYLLMENLEHWETRPANVSIALDILAARVFNIRRYQINWSNGNELNPEVSDGDWPVSTDGGSSSSAGFVPSKPSTWKWYSKAVQPHSAISDDPGSKSSEYVPAYLSDTEYKSLDEAQQSWPKSYYVVLPEGPGAVTVVNPYSMYGTGKAPGPKSDDVVLNKFLRADNTWQNVPPGTLIFNDYDEFKLWYTSTNHYESDDIGSDGETITKPARIAEVDLDRIIFIISDTSWWRTPSTYGAGGATPWTSWSGTAIKANVPVEIKPINTDFEVNWSSYINWAAAYTANSGTWAWAGIGVAPTTNHDNAKALWPKGYYTVVNGSYLRKVNPFNPTGNGLVPGPITSEVEAYKFLKSDGSWQVPVSGDIHFYIHGWPLAGFVMGQAISAQDFTTDTIYWYVDNLPAGASLVVNIAECDADGTGQTTFATITIAPGGSKNGTVSFADRFIDATHIVRAVISATGTTPNEGGNDLVIVVKQKA